MPWPKIKTKEIKLYYLPILKEGRQPNLGESSKKKKNKKKREKKKMLEKSNTLERTWQTYSS